MMHFIFIGCLGFIGVSKTWKSTILVATMNQTENVAANDGEYSIPHYMLPNFSSILPEYANAEAEHIKCAFSTGNFMSIVKMPNKLAPNSVSQARQECIDENRQSAIVLRGPPKMITKCGLFNQFEYTPSRYSLSEELLRAVRRRMIRTCATFFMRHANSC
jgi:hypothetical protein